MDEAFATRTSLRSTAATAGALIEHDSIFDRDSADDLTPTHAEWCVDLGDELKAMNKFELWLALGTGDVAADARVWKVGRECWQPAHEIPDLACALKLHANVLIATVNAARETSDDERPTVVPGELPTTEPRALSASTSPAAEPTREASAPGGDEANEAEDAMTQQETSETAAFPFEARPEGVEVEAKSITPGPAVVDAPESVAPAPIALSRRKARRKAEPNAWSIAAAIALLVGTSAFAASRVTGGEAPSAAAHLPSLPSAARAASPAPAAESPERPATPIEIDPTLQTGISEAPTGEVSIARSETDEARPPAAPKATERHVVRPGKRNVRPTSVSPSHRGQGRQRQHSR